MSDAAKFNYCTLHASIPVSYSDFDLSHNFFFDDKNHYRTAWCDNSFETIRAHFFRVAQVEHEFFHCRHFLSSSFGLFAHILSLIEQDQKEYFIEDCMTRELFLTPVENIVSYEAALKCGYSKSCMESIVFYGFWRYLKEFVLRPQQGSLEALLRQQRLVLSAGLATGAKDSKRLIRVDLPFPQPPMLKNIRKPRTREVRDELLPTLHLLEGVAVWREYLYVSRLAGFSGKRCGDLTTAWLTRTLVRPAYRAAADLIYEKTGCNLASALTGVLLDVSLCGPFFGNGSYDWSELHPSLRFEHMLRIAGELPKSLRKPDNLDLLGDDFYDEVAHFFESRLGWQTVRSNMRDTLDFINAEAAKTYHSEGTTISDEMRALKLSKFAIAIGRKSESISAFLLSWGDDKTARIGYATQPLLVDYADKIVVGIPLRDVKPQFLIGYLRKVATVLASNDLVDSMPGDGHNRFKEARRFLNAARQHVVQKWSIDPSQLTALPDLDGLMSQWLKFDWDQACRERLASGH